MRILDYLSFQKPNVGGSWNNKSFFKQFCTEPQGSVPHFWQVDERVFRTHKTKHAL